MTQPTGTSAGATATAGQSAATGGGAGMGVGATTQADRDALGADVAETPWHEDGEDYGRDLGTGATDEDGNEPEHNVETPRDLDGDHGAATPPVEEEVEAPQSNAAPTANQTQRTPAPSVPTTPSGNDQEQQSKQPTGTPPTAPTGGNG